MERAISVTDGGEGARFGLSCALALPVRPDASVDLPRLAAHAGWCLAEGCRSITIFGTTGEGASLGPTARGAIMAAIAGAGIDLSRQVIGGVAAASIEDAVLQMRTIFDAGCRGVLMTPPFYFKDVTDDGLFAWFAGVFEKAAAGGEIILYNIPPVTQVTLSVDLIDRLKTAFPGLVTGVKDSSGDWDYTKRLLAAHAELAILVGDERHLAPAMRLGAMGAISGLANVIPGALSPLIAEHREDARIVAIVDALLRYPVTAAVKALIAHRTGDPSWLAMRPPLAALPEPAAADLGALFDRLFPAKVA